MAAGDRKGHVVWEKVTVIAENLLKDCRAVAFATGHEPYSVTCAWRLGQCVRDAAPASRGAGSQALSFSLAGTRDYGHTKSGAYMCEAEAQTSGNRAAMTNTIHEESARALFDAAMVRSRIDIKTFEADVPSWVTRVGEAVRTVWPSASGTVLCWALNSAEQIAPAPPRLGFRRLSWPDTAPHPFA